MSSSTLLPPITPRMNFLSALYVKKQNLLDEKDLTSIERGLADICEINVHCPGTYVRHIPFLVFQLRFVFVRHKHSDIIEETKSVSIIVGSNSMHWKVITPKNRIAFLNHIYFISVSGSDILLQSADFKASKEGDQVQGVPQLLFDLRVNESCLTCLAGTI